MLIMKEILIYTLCYFGLFSSTLLMIVFFQNIRTLKHPKPKYFPKVSIIVPAFNEERSLRKTVESLFSLDYPKELLEIMIIDDGSRDDTLKIAKTYESKGVKVFTKKNTGKADTLNYGLARCSGEVVGALDADSFVRPDALKKMIAYFEQKRVMCVVPSVKIWQPKGILSRIQAAEFLSALFIRKSFSYLGGVPITPGPFTLYKRWFFDTYGGYNTETLTEDIEIALRIESKKFVIESVIDANVYTDPVHGLKKVYTQRLRWFKGFIDNIIAYRFMIKPSYGNLGMFILPISIISIILGIGAFSYSMARLGSTFAQNLVNWYLIGFDISTWFQYDFDTFFINTGPLLIIPLIAIAIAVVILLFAREYSKEKQPWALSALSFFMIYWMIYSVCWASAIAHRVAKRTVYWGKQ